jgi:N-acetylmuramate 1-kinase
MRSEAVDFARQALGMAGSIPVEVAPLGKRGSDRSFFRLTWTPDQSAILINYDPKRQENCYHAEIAEFLYRIGVPAPRMIHHDPAQRLVLMEDLGEVDLWSLRNSDPDARGALYRETIIALHRLHSFPEQEFPSHRVQLMGHFDAALYRWEQDYFRQHFVGAVCGVKLDSESAYSLEIELFGLAERLIAGPRCLVHRDLQSQNVMIHKGKPVFIDFQGMRFGSPFYDLGSLLCDPYVEFAEKERDAYLSLYYSLSNWGCDWDTFRDYFWQASTQRLMQALGAYGFLSLSKGLIGFLDHIPAGLRNLQNAASRVAALPNLQKLLGMCRAAWMKRTNQPDGAFP